MSKPIVDNEKGYKSCYMHVYQINRKRIYKKILYSLS